MSERVTMVNRKSKWEKNENEGILVRICLGGQAGTIYLFMFLHRWKRKVLKHANLVGFQSNIYIQHKQNIAAVASPSRFYSLFSSFEMK